MPTPQTSLRAGTSALGTRGVGFTVADTYAAYQAYLAGGMLARYTPDSLVLSGGQPVGWRNTIGNAVLPLPNGAAGYQAANSGFNGKATVRIDPDHAFSVGLPVPASATGFTVLLVLATAASTAPDGQMLVTLRDPSNNVLDIWTNNRDNTALFLNSLQSGDYIGNGASSPQLQPRLIVARIPGDPRAVDFTQTGLFWQDGVQLPINVPDNRPASYPFDWSGGSEFFLGYMPRFPGVYSTTASLAEVILWPRQLTDSEITAAMSYVRTPYGL